MTLINDDDLKEVSRIVEVTTPAIVIGTGNSLICGEVDIICGREFSLDTIASVSKGRKLILHRLGQQEITIRYKQDISYGSFPFQLPEQLEGHLCFACSGRKRQQDARGSQALERLKNGNDRPIDSSLLIISGPSISAIAIGREECSFLFGISDLERCSPTIPKRFTSWKRRKHGADGFWRD